MSRKKDKKSSVLKDVEMEPSTSKSISSSLLNPEMELTEECLNWANLLPLALEVVFQTLIRGTEPHSILICRLVNSHWKSVAESVVEQSSLSDFKTIPPKSSSLIPKLEIVSSESDDSSLEKVWCPKFIQNWEQNPFPSKSLIIQRSSHHQQHIQKQNYSPVSVFKLMGNLGHNLSSFRLDNVSFNSPYFLKLLLDEMNNLRALSLSHINLMTEDKNFRETYTFAPLGQLELLNLHLNIIVSVKHEFRCGTFNQWLVNCYGRTLTHLEIDEAEELSFNSDNFPNLQVLTLREVGKDTFRISEGIPRLKKLSIFHLSDESFHTTRFEDYISFIEKFAPELLYLNLTVWMDEMESQKISFRRNPIPSFPNLKSFTSIFPSRNNESGLVALRSYFLPRFPALTKLILLFFNQTSHYKTETDEDGNRKVINNYLKQEDFWRICPKLQSIHVFGGPNGKEDAFHVRYRPK